MKLRVFISLLFVISTTFASVHEIEHITGEHEHSSCQICTVNDNLNLRDLDSGVNNTTFLLPICITFSNQLLSNHKHKTTNHSNAPPKIS